MIQKIPIFHETTFYAHIMSRCTCQFFVRIFLRFSTKLKIHFIIREHVKTACLKKRAADRWALCSHPHSVLPETVLCEAGCFFKKKKEGP
jgi:hypothetical protein